MTLQLTALQFPHPGTEHNARAYVGGVFPWNVGEHHRKFLEARGTWISDDARGEGDLRFWGEWEATSDVVQALPNGGKGYPKWLHRARVDADGGGERQNTDPLVVGGFHYSNCRQHRLREQHSPTKQMALDVGSVILFGSKSQGWVVDTVFVVGGRQVYGRDDVDALAASDPLLGYAALRPLYSKPDRDLEFVLYRGATIDSAVDGRYSFVPAAPAEQVSFARPVIDLPSINVNLTQQTRVLGSGQNDVGKVWDSIREQVLNAGLVLATGIEAPTGLAGPAAVGRTENGKTKPATVGRPADAC